MRAAALLAVLALSGCGGSSNTVIVTRTASKAHEAADLAAAYRAGLLTPAEYADQQQRLGLSR